MKSDQSVFELPCPQVKTNGGAGGSGATEVKQVYLQLLSGDIITLSNRSREQPFFQVG